MIAPMYINTSIGHQFSIESNQKIHTKKLNNIKSRKPIYPNNINDSQLVPLTRNRWKSVCNCKKKLVKTEEIKNQNMKLLERLVDISLKRCPSFSGSYLEKKSLNYGIRKKTTRDIEENNKKIAKRIATKRAEIDVEDLNKDFLKFLKFRKRISRVEVLESRKNCKKSSREDHKKKNETPNKYVSPCLRNEGIRVDHKINDDVINESN